MGKYKVTSIFYVLLLFSFSNASLITDGLLAYYQLNGTATDASGNNNDGIINNTLSVSDRNGNVDGAMHFDGINANIEIPPLQISGSMTISFWLQTNVTDYNNWPWATFIVDRDVAYTQRDWSICIGNGGLIQFNTGGDTRENVLLSSRNVNNNEWINVTVVRDAENLVNQIYLDGILDVSKAFDNLSFTNTSENIYLAQSNCLPEQHKNLNGNLDDILFYNRALSSSEILEIQDLSTVENVPEPGIISLFGVGIIALSSLRFVRRKK